MEIDNTPPEVYARNFLEKLREHSQNKEDPVSEWDVLNDTDNGIEFCLCGKKIHNIFVIQNKITLEAIGIGSECVKRWLECDLKCRRCNCELGNVMKRRREKKFYCRSCRKIIELQGNLKIYHNYSFHYFKDIVQNVPLLEILLNSGNSKIVQTLRDYASNFYELDDIEV